VIVRDGKVLSQGFTQACGGHHAEIEALHALEGSAKGATLYVTLEPCAATGRTPPCTAAIIESGISTVVFASADPNPKMAGGGEVLQHAGITVISGINQAEADALNRPFFHNIHTTMPWVIAKAAISLDGKLATQRHDSQWISSGASRQHAHQIRALCDAIVVGAGTLLSDNPSLTVRDAPLKGKPPLRVVMCGQTPDFFNDCKLLSDAAPSRFYVLKNHAHDQKWRDAGMDIVVCEDLKACFQHLAQHGALQVLLEGGGKLHAACFAAQISNEILLYQAPILLGGLDAINLWHGLGVDMVSDALHIEDITRQNLDTDQVIRGTIAYPA